MKKINLILLINIVIVIYSCGRDTKTMENRIVGHWIEKMGDSTKSQLYFSKIEDNGTGYIYYKTSGATKHKFKIEKVDETVGYITLGVDNNPFSKTKNTTDNVAFYVSTSNKRLTFNYTGEERVFVYEDSKTEP